MMLDRLLLPLRTQFLTTLSDIIRTQIDHLKILSRIYPETVMLELSHDQYHVLSTINMYLGKSDNGVSRWPYYFITSSAGTSNHILSI